MSKVPSKNIFHPKHPRQATLFNRREDLPRHTPDPRLEQCANRTLFRSRRKEVAEVPPAAYQDWSRREVIEWWKRRIRTYISPHSPKGLTSSSNDPGAYGSLGHTVMIRSGNNNDRELNILLSCPTNAPLLKSQ